MKTRFIALALAIALGPMTACERGTPPDDAEKPTSASPSAAFGLDAHTFEGDGSDDYVKSDPVELFGQYTIKWEVSGNGLSSTGEPSIFEADLKGEEVVPVLTKDVVDDSGKVEVQIDEPGMYYAYVFSGPGAHWKLTLTRTCAGVPPECDPLE